jgi:LysW-gamma-L-lysine carboxypeptidase
VGLRLPPGFDIEAMREKITSWAGEGRVEFRGYEPAYSGERTSVLARAFSRVFRDRGMRPRMKHKTGTSDMNVVGPVWQCPILAYGPGDSSLDHTPIEHLRLEEYHKAIEVLARAIETWRELAE